ncbi:MAG TPA: MFS transporter [Caldilineae bacterium]|nr:MFS transporter [Caldilineae bacterium]
MMLLNRSVAQVRATLSEYPRPFWTLVGASFIDNLGGALLFPFFTLYVTAKFGVGMTTVGLLFALFSITSVVGSTVGGALTDRLGARRCSSSVCWPALPPYWSWAWPTRSPCSRWARCWPAFSPTPGSPPSKLWSPTSCRSTNGRRVMAFSA